MDDTALAQAGAEVQLDGGQQPRGAVGDDQQRSSQSPSDQVGQEVVPRVGGLGRGRRQAHEHWVAIGVDAPGGQHRLGRGGGVHLEVGGVQVQVVEAHVGQGTGLPGLELVVNGGADATHRRLGQGGLGPKHLGQGGLDVTVGQAPHPPGDDQGLQGVRAGHAHPEQPGAEHFVGVTQLGPGQLDGSHGGLHRGRRLPAVAGSGRAVFSSTLVGGSAQGLGHLGLQGRLHHQAHAQAGHVLQDRGQVTLRCEQLIYLGADALRRRYSFRHGCRSSFVSWLCFFRRNLRPSSFTPVDGRHPRCGGRRSLRAPPQRWSTSRSD